MDQNRTIRVGVIGLGGRGRGQIDTLMGMPDVEIVAVCDVYADRVELGQKNVEDAGRPRPLGTLDYHEVLAREDIEAVFIFTSWQTHAKIALDALNAGKQTAFEVGGASSLQECWDLVHAVERTGLNCTLLENCCYGREEMHILNMIKKGLFGEVVHCEGGYQHDLRDEVGNGDINRHYRQDNFLSRNGELYPTHELGPIAKYININRGNRMLYLTSMASKARGLHAWIEQHRPDDERLMNAQVNEGDVVTTMIRCANGETIVLTHDCTLPRPYSRGNRVEGTKGIWMEDKMGVFLDGISPVKVDEWPAEEWEPLEKYRAEYEHPLWKWYEEYGLRGGHGGMDYLVLRSFIEAVQKGETAPIDVYDSVSWMAITCLSEESIAMGSQPVAIPDFTNGAWMKRKPEAPGRYALDAVYPEYCKFEE